MKAGDDISGIQDDGSRLQSLVDQTIKLSTNAHAKQQLNDINAQAQDFSDLVKQLKSMNMTDGLGFANEHNLFEFGVNIVKAAQAVQTDAQKALTNGDLSTNRLTNNVTSTLVVISVLAILVAIFIGFYVARSLSRPINSIAKIATRIADGDLTITKVSVRSKDEVGMLAAAFNRMLDSLKELIGQIQSSAVHLASSSEELTASAEQTSEATQSIAATIQELAAGADKQASHLVDTTKAVHGLTNSIEEIALNTQSAATSAQSASGISEAGAAAIETSVSQMKSIQVKTDSLAEAVQKLGARSQEIGSIVGTITDIAAQTNLLSLNAAIEAARAGEHGKGFAVVATEVRKLAEMSAASANQIKDLVANTIEDTNAAVSMTDSATKEVSEGIRVVYEAGEAFRQIQGAIQSVVEQVEHVSDEVQNMVAGTEEIAGTVEEVAQVANASASGSENVSAAAEEQLATMEEVTASALALSTMAEELQDLVKRFELNA